MKLRYQMVFWIFGWVFVLILSDDGIDINSPWTIQSGRMPGWGLPRPTGPNQSRQLFKSHYDYPVDCRQNGWRPHSDLWSSELSLISFVCNKVVTNCRTHVYNNIGWENRISWSSEVALTCLMQIQFVVQFLLGRGVMKLPICPILADFNN